MVRGIQEREHFRGVTFVQQVRRLPQGDEPASIPLEVTFGEVDRVGISFMPSILPTHTRPKLLVTGLKINQHRSCTCIGCDLSPSSTVVRGPEAVVDDNVSPGLEMLSELDGDLFEDGPLKGREDAAREVHPINAIAGGTSFHPGTAVRTREP